MKTLETIELAPQGWTERDFDDSGWTETTLPISWHLNHIALFRTTFNLADSKKYDLLKFKSWVFRQQDVAIYLNGVLMIDFTDPQPKSFDGYIALQLHSGGLGDMRFKDIRINDLSHP